jgi:hypothetical protein
LTQSGIDKIALQCPFGSLGMIVEDGIGINQKDLDFYDYCLAKDTFGNKKCSDAVNTTYVKETFQKECHEKKKCSIDTSKLLKTLQDEDSQCLDHSFIFIQYKCFQAEDVQYKKFNLLAVVTVSVMLVAFTFFMLTYYLTITSKLNQMKYNISTVTANDFTCELDISQRSWNDFLKNEYNPKG